VQTYFCFKFNRVTRDVSPASDLMKTGNDEGIRQLLKLFCHSRAYQAESLSPDYIVVRTGETLTPQQSCTLSEWSQRPLFVAAGPSTPAIEIVDQDDDDYNDDNADYDTDDADDYDDADDADDGGFTDKNDAKHMRPSPEP
jgi:hypothetical protein